MISYKPFWETIERKKITQYQLIKKYNMSNSLIDKLKHNKNIRLSTIDDICMMLDCRIENVVEIVKNSSIGEK